jgi:glycerol-3-phosphate O-acyltransferase
MGASGPSPLVSAVGGTDAKPNSRIDSLDMQLGDQSVAESLRRFAITRQLLIAAPPRSQRAATLGGDAAPLAMSAATWHLGYSQTAHG